ncbi:MAG: AhpD family alkylhydroperoxidase like protein [Bacteroidetes bacterium]|nr:MAG: AhpD family alkylhydroperoxidase like protein [Bacteroidota bacterium]
MSNAELRMMNGLTLRHSAFANRHSPFGVRNLYFSVSKNPLMNTVDEFNAYRAKMNERILGQDNLVLKRLFNLDTNTYQEGALPVKTKELLGLVASMVLRCDDCIRYHLGKCYEQGVTRDELFEVFAVANIVGGTIVIPHTRRAVEYWDELEKYQQPG